MRIRRRLTHDEANHLNLTIKEKTDRHRSPLYDLSEIELAELIEYRRKHRKKNKHKRYRMSDHTARKLGITPTKAMRYTLNKEQLKAYMNLDMEQPVRRLFFDIETSPMIVYSWRIGYKINLNYENVIENWKIICISYKWEHEDKVRNLVWDKDQCDKQMLIDFIKIANTADELVAHNGDRFDIKKVRTRCIYHRIPMFPKYRSLDTLKKSRGSFDFPSNRLDVIARYLGIGAKLEHEGFPMWVKCMQGDEQALKDMLKYCDMDIIVLEDVFLTIQNYIKPNTHAGVHAGNLKHSCPICGNGSKLSLLKNDVTQKGTIS